ncbi:MAG TPA: GTPase Era [Paenalcaligenes sp.]|nr:GTPase Era [Paenalcaligenes sp.]
MTESAFKCGFVAVVGRPNVGKSTLTNALVGAKVSIVSRKAQTTRHRIHSVLTREDEQFVFVDTPGFQTRHKGAMNRMMNRVVTKTLGDVDVVLHVLEANVWTSEDAQVVDLLPDNTPVIAVLNKIDRVKDKTVLLPYIEKLMQRFDYAEVVPVSAWRRTQLDVLLDQIGSYLPESPPFFDEETLTDRPMRFIAAELLREKIFRLVGDELPYGCTVFIEHWQEDDKGVHIAACVLVERESHRPILLGKEGLHMKRIASEARQDIARMLDKPVYLEVFVKVRRGWQATEAQLRELGYE